MNGKFELNKAQKEAVETLKGPLLILAGAGAGKTKVIVERISNLIRNGANPSHILAITFTNKAANEMRERVQGVLEQKHLSDGSDREKPFVSTFHSLGVYILRENHQIAGLPKFFNIFDKSDSKNLIKECLEEAGFNPKEYDPSKILSIISKEKGAGVDLESFNERENGEFFGKLVSRVWKLYETKLKKEGAVDFDDLLLKTERLLEQKDVREHYQEKWKFIHIDEYQDTNHAQYLIAKHLTGKENNICAVGDIDQNIYSWRGARLKNILDFEKDFPNTKLVVLEENYRSTKNILEVANHIIKKNSFRKEKNLFTNNQTGEAITFYEAFDENSEAEFVASKVKNLIESGTNPEEVVVLYRANFQSRALEEVFISQGISYKLIGTRFFERKEIKDLLSYVKASINRSSFSDLKRVLSSTPKGIGKVSLLKILEGKTNELTNKGMVAWKETEDLLNKIEEKIKLEKVSDILKFILKESGLEKKYKNGSEDDMERYENLRELVSLSSRYNSEPGMSGVEKLLTDVALYSDQDDVDEKIPGVRLMTIHSAKGLEFQYVFIVGLEEGLFPHEHFGEDITPEESEEERRLFYVAITRAKKKIFLSFAQTRSLFGRREVNMPSEFFFDIPENFLEKEEGHYGLLGKPIKVINF